MKYHNFNHLLLIVSKNNENLNNVLQRILLENKNDFVSPATLHKLDDALEELYYNCYCLLDILCEKYL